MSQTHLNRNLDSATLTSQNIVAVIGGIFERYGDQEYLGEQVTIAEHMLQAATIASESGFSESLIIAALLHDVGHFTSELGTFDMRDTDDRFHEDAGADFLKAFLPPEVINMVRYHVPAKRYLCATNSNYFNCLSAASIHSLSLQGGPMSVEEVADFKMLPQLSDIVQLRYLDDAGKKTGMKTPDYWYFAPMIQRLVDNHMLSLNPSPTP